METTNVIVKYLGSDKKLYTPISKINWDNITYINASWKGINNLNWMKPCPNLQYLHILGNCLWSLSGLPEELPNLQHLDLYGNNLSLLCSLPKKLSNLKYLNISCNKLTSLSGLPEKLPNLQCLSLFKNNLSSPSGLPQELPNLQNLELYHNNLCSLSGLPKELPNLKYLNMANNNLSSLSGLPQEMPNLEWLYLSINKLSSLSGLPKELPNLQRLIIPHNNLSSLSGLPEELPNLQFLNIKYNAQITTFPNFLINYRNLERINYEGLELELEPRMRRWLNRLQNHRIDNTTQVYGNSQNVHDSSIQETVRQSMKRLLDQKNMPKLCLDTLRNQIVQDNILTPKSKDQLLEYIQSEEELHELCLTYGDLLWVVWQTLHGYSKDIQEEIKNILNQELQDSDCKCFTGRMTRLVNCLNGFCDLVEVKILDSAQIGNIVLMIRQKLEQSEEGYSSEKHREEFKKEMLSRGENDEVIGDWLEYIK